MQTLIQHIRFSIRMLTKRPGFTAVAVTVLTLGIGANSTIFSFVNALLFRPPAQVEEPDRLLEIWNKVALVLLIASIENESYEIVGVVKTGKYRTLGENPRPYLYRSFLQHYHPKATLVAHTAGDPGGLLPSIRREVQALDPNLALIRPGTLQEHLALALFPAYATGILLSVFGLVALILAIVGIAGVIAYAVSQRTHEIGIRLALGAQQNEVLRMVVHARVSPAIFNSPEEIDLALQATASLA